ncbi:MAG: hypothetical protein H6R10_49 [Rhodocyclaceae bacterium]|nr:hypothetical protein [Rhodocyclaceae bacterium]
MKWQSIYWLLPLGLLAGGGAHGEEAAMAAKATAGAPQQGATTRQWLERQRQGTQAAAKAQPLSGPVQEQIHERYRKSFTHPIPENFEREAIGTGGASR